MCSLLLFILCPQAVKDWMIVALISVLVGIDVVILVIVTAVPELRPRAMLKQSTENPQTVTGVCFFVGSCP